MSVDAFLRVLDGPVPGPLLGLLTGVLLGLSPLALPSIPAVMATVGSHSAPTGPESRGLPLWRSIPSIIAFTAGLHGVLGVLGYAFVSVTILLARTAVAFHLVAVRREAPCVRGRVRDPTRWPVAAGR